MLTFKYNLHGGSLTSIKVDGVEKLYQPMENSWSGQDVVIFPFVARLKDKTYSHNGKIYTLLNHGVARYSDFNILKENENSVTLILESNEETRKIYPFDFVLYVTYTAIGNALEVEYKVHNTCKEKMYFGIGGHPAIKVDYENNDTKRNYLRFENEMDLYYYTMDESYSFVGERKLLGRFKEIEMDKSFFKKYGTLLLDSKDIDKVYLYRKNGEIVEYCIENRDFLAIWSHSYCGDYVCVEPWDSLPDFIDADKELKDKKTIKSLDQGKEYLFKYSIRFES